MNKILTFLLVAIVASAGSAFAHDDHEKVIVGPNGGRVLTKVEPRLEFFVTEDRKIKLTAVSKDAKPKAIKIGEQEVKVIAGKRLAPTRIGFSKSGNSLISDKALPEGLDVPVVVQIKATAKSKTVLERLQLNLRDCPTCDFKEYACPCHHHH